MNINEIPTYLVSVTEDEELGITANSLVKSPAIEIDFQFFGAEKQYFKDVLKHKVTGPMILANTRIFRRDPIIGEHYVVFEPDIIELMADKFMKNNINNNVTLNHNKRLVKGIYITEFYIKDSTKGIVNKDFENVPDGSLMATYKIEDNNIWNEIIKGDDSKLRGYSIEVGYQLGSLVNGEKYIDTTEISNGKLFEENFNIEEEPEIIISTFEQLFEYYKNKKNK